MSSVLQDWVQELPLMMQGTILTGIRGNDLAHAPNLKPVVRWLRSIICNNGNPENDFMVVDDLPSVEEFEDELEYLSCHYFLHLLHTLEIVGYRHPDYDISEIALDYYFRLVDWCHLTPETHEELTFRLSGEPGTTGKSKEWVKTLMVDDFKAERFKPTASPPPAPLHQNVNTVAATQAPVHSNYGRAGS